MVVAERVIEIVVAGESFTAELYDNDAADTFYGLLPLDNLDLYRWGEEYYGDMGHHVPNPSNERLRAEMEVGELAIWSNDNLCIFWGPTPASNGEQPVAASPVIPIGRLIGEFVNRLSGLGTTVSVDVRKNSDA